MTESYKAQTSIELWLWAQRHCRPCVHFIDEPGSPGIKMCSLNIVRKSLAYDTDDEHYPSELIYQDGLPVCTAEEVSN